MKEIYLVVFIAVFSGGPEVHVELVDTLEECEDRAAEYWVQPAGVYEGQGVRAISAECHRIMPHSLDDSVAFELIMELDKSR